MDRTLPAMFTSSPRPDASRESDAKARASSPFRGILLALLLSLPIWLLLAWLIIHFS